MIPFAQASLGKAATAPAGPPAIVFNGTFDNGVAGWTAQQNAILSVNAGRLRVTTDAAGTAGATAKQTVVSGLASNRTYRFQARMWASDPGMAGIVFEGMLASRYVSGNGPTDVDFTFSGLSFLHINLQIGSGGAWGPANGWAEFDDVSIEEV